MLALSPLEALEDDADVDVAKAARVPMDAAAATAWKGPGGGAALALALIKAARELSKTVDRKKLAAAIDYGGGAAALKAFDLADVVEDVVEPAALETLWRGYALGIGHADRLAGLVTKARVPLFAVRNERQIRALIGESKLLSQRFLTGHGKITLDAIIRAGAANGWSTRRTADLIVNGHVIGLDERRVRAVVRFLHGQIAGGVRLDIAHRRTEAYSRRLLRQRAEVLARTETQRLLHVGTVDGWLDLQARGRLPRTAVMVWHVRPEACAVCEPLDGATAPIGGLFLGRYRYPPVHPNCRCVLSIRQAGAKTPAEQGRSMRSTRAARRTRR